MAKVYIGVGHGASDSGAVANGLKEKDVNLEVALACRDKLKANGVDVKISRTGDTDQGINAKVSEANKWGADYVVEIHHNAGGGDGAEVYYSVNGGKGKTLAQNVLDGIVALGQQSRGIKTKTTSDGRNYFGIIRDTVAPAILVECAFLDSKDYKIVDTAAERKAMGEAIANGVLETLGIKEKAEVKTEATYLYKVQIGSFSKKANAEALVTKAKKAGFDAVIVTVKS